MSSSEVQSYDEVLRRNVAAYDRAVEERAAGAMPAWKLEEHERFRRRLEEIGATSIVEVGAGTGFHSRRFADEGFEVLATDPSPQMVAHCRSIGLRALEADAVGLRLDAPVDAVFSMNSLLHVPVARLPAALRALREAVREDGLVFIGMYGGEDHEGTRDDDHYVPKRWFVSHSDDRLLAIAAGTFDIVDFHRVEFDGREDVHFQSLTVRRDAGGLEPR